MIDTGVCCKDAIQFRSHIIRHKGVLLRIFRSWSPEQRQRIGECRPHPTHWELYRLVICSHTSSLNYWAFVMNLPIAFSHLYRHSAVPAFDSVSPVVPLRSWTVELAGQVRASPLRITDATRVGGLVRVSYSRLHGKNAQVLVSTGKITSRQQRLEARG